MDLKTAPEIAAVYRVKVPTVRIWTRKGMPHLRCGRLYRYDPHEVFQWLKQQQSTRESTRIEGV